MRRSPEIVASEATAAAVPTGRHAGDDADVRYAGTEPMACSATVTPPRVAWTSSSFTGRGGLAGAARDRHPWMVSQPASSLQRHADTAVPVAPPAARSSRWMIQGDHASEAVQSPTWSPSLPDGRFTNWNHQGYAASGAPPFRSSRSGLGGRSLVEYTGVDVDSPVEPFTSRLSQERARYDEYPSTHYAWPTSARPLDDLERRSSESTSSHTSVKSNKGDSEFELDDDGLAEDEGAANSVQKTSRYLREMDRRVILERLAKGERQATLAKEFNVSRAAICNLYKHRVEVLARSDENPFAKHPKKKKKKPVANPVNKRQGRGRVDSDSQIPSRSSSTSAFSTLAGSTNTTARSSSLSSLPSDTKARPPPATTLHVVRSAALQLLLSALSDRSRPLADFRRNSERVLWIILEEALALVPLKDIDMAQTDQLGFPTYAAESPPCTISMEQQTVGATPMLDIFQLMEPHQPCSTARLATRGSDLHVEIAEVGVPQALHCYNVFLFDVVAASGEAVCAVIHQLMRSHGALEANISVVSLFTSSEVVAMVQCKYPKTRIVTARIDSSITRRRIASTPVDLILQRMRQAYACSQ